MYTGDEKLRILKMVEEGKITAEEGAKLLNAMETGKSTSEEENVHFPKQVNTKGKALRIRITEMDSNKTKINLTFPLKFAKFIKAMIPPMEKIKLEHQGVNLDDILDSIGSSTEGKIVDISDEEDGHHIEVWIE